jgi:hypothetical protein
MNRYLVVGCGFFGRLAVQNLLRKDPTANIIAVDKNKTAIEKMASFPVETSVEDGISFLSHYLDRDPEAYVIPAVPFHLAFECILSRLKEVGGRRGKIPPIAGLPNFNLGRTGDLYTSMARFICPEDCPEPSQYCTVTGEKRGRPLYQILKDLSGAFHSKVIRSEQLGMGVGGFKAKKPLDLVEEIERTRSPGPLILISTACCCHGVTSALTFSKGSRK